LKEFDPMKPALISFSVTAALLALNVLPGAWTAAQAPKQGTYEARHATENKAEVAARLGLREI
jgi:hypothetical protein